MIVLATKSQRTINEPPKTNDIGITSLCFEPNIFLTTWGAIKSIKPITPTNDIALPVSAAESPRRIHLIYEHLHP